MKLIWYGHSCFVLEQDGYRIVTDPYEGVEGYPPLQVEAHEVYCSHQHFDHNAEKCVTLLPKTNNKSPFFIREVDVFHDDKQGALRGKNTIRIFTANGVSVAHMGDLGHLLSQEQIQSIGKLDAILIPVGGFYTIDAAGAKAVCNQLSPRCILPMHYRHTPYGLPNIDSLDNFLTLWSQSDIHFLDSAELELSKNLSGIFVPKFITH